MLNRERYKGRLIDHIGLVVRDLPASKKFYTAVFEAVCRDSAVRTAESVVVRY